MGDRTDIEIRARELEKRLTAVYDEMLNLPDYAPLRPRKESEYERLLAEYQSVVRDIQSAQGQISLFEEE